MVRPCRDRSRYVLSPLQGEDVLGSMVQGWRAKRAYPLATIFHAFSVKTKRPALYGLALLTLNNLLKSEGSITSLPAV